MLAKLKAIYTAITAGITATSVWGVLFAAVKTALVSIIFNPKVLSKAYEIAIALRNDTTLSTAKKALEFNKQMAKFLVDNGYISTDTVVNFLRELVCLTIKTKEASGSLPKVEAPVEIEEKKEDAEAK